MLKVERGRRRGLAWLSRDSWCRRRLHETGLGADLWHLRRQVRSSLVELGAFRARPRLGRSEIVCRAVEDLRLDLLRPRRSIMFLKFALNASLLVIIFIVLIKILPILG